MNKKSIIALFTVVALILGYVIGVFVGFPNVNSTLLSGDIGKANKHKQSTVNEKIKAVEEKLQNVETFNMADLVVMENTNVNNESTLYILRATNNGGICHEYHNEFDAWYRLHPDSEEHKYDLCDRYIHFNESQPLFNYLII